MSAEAYRVLMAAMSHARPGETWSADSWRDQADMAQLKSAERGAAQARAVDEGYLRPLGEFRDGRWLPLCDRTTHVAGKGRWVQVYERTATLLPGQQPSRAELDQAEAYERGLTLDMTDEERRDYHRRCAENLPAELDGQLALVEVPA
jgi:hypothetical protein